MAYSPPASVLIVGSGVFGLGTAEALTRRPEFANSTITVVDRGSGVEGHPADPDGGVNDFPARDAASIDSSRIIRADYADPAYAALAADALEIWRGRKKGYGASETHATSDAEDYIGGGGRYRESGLICIADKADDDTKAEAEPGKFQAKKTGMYYVRESYANVQALAADDAYLRERLEELPNPEAIRAAIGTGGTTGDWGYINRASGWADAAASMAWVYERVKKTGRVAFVRGEVASFIKDETKKEGTVTGVTLRDGRQLSADLTIAATGAWTESVVQSDKSTFKNTLAATGQVLGYVPLTAEEHAQIVSIPVVLNLSTGLFVIPPAPDVLELKVARHAFGYINPDAPSSSTPLTHLTTPGLTIPAEGAAALRRGLTSMVPIPGVADRPFSKTRICWYTDTPTGDFIIDYHPHMPGLFVATGGSGHGFKFLPVLGEKIVDCVVGKCPEAFRTKWAWRESPSAEGEATTVVTDDGSRGGLPGLILRDELAKTA
ncbi:fad dependent oxidoreductase [Ophiostoma piceae UAMH 11346]|uniref:Fad dependent oxidoreductase n=1 Tax=Ophiostoma piceae (strain UAMH 11346) TaxID=1262450 RepID=S3C9C4_OPHP1|nr:fad dependent oxidoreductase [Ophiostoma piceae UAMH 11346]